MNESSANEDLQSRVERLEELIGIHFAVISVGPDREQTIIRDAAVLDALFA